MYSALNKSSFLFTVNNVCKPNTLKSLHMTKHGRKYCYSNWVSMCVCEWMCALIHWYGWVFVCARIALDTITVVIFYTHFYILNTTFSPLSIFGDPCCTSIYTHYTYFYCLSCSLLILYSTKTGVLVSSLRCVCIWSTVKTLSIFYFSNFLLSFFRSPGVFPFKIFQLNE